MESFCLHFMSEVAVFSTLNSGLNVRFFIISYMKSVLLLWSFFYVQKCFLTPRGLYHRSTHLSILKKSNILSKISF